MEAYSRVKAIPAGGFELKPGRAEDTAQKHVDVVFLDKLGCVSRRPRVVACAVLDDQFDATAEQAAGRVDFVHDRRGNVGLGGAHDGEGARLVGDHTDLDCVSHDVAPTPRSGR
jgi:hypothetical protein